MDLSDKEQSKKQIASLIRTKSLHRNSVFELVLQKTQVFFFFPALYSITNSFGTWMAKTFINVIETSDFCFSFEINSIFCLCIAQGLYPTV